MMRKDTYSLSFTTGGLFHRESLLLARLFGEVNDWDQVRDHVLSENLLQSRTLNTSKRQCREIISRLETLEQSELDLLIYGSTQEQKYLLWMAVCRRYRFIAEFAEEVIRERYIGMKQDLQYVEFDFFINKKSEWHPELEAIQPTTRNKLRQVLFKILREADLLTTKNTINASMLSQRFLAAIPREKRRDVYVFPRFESDIKWRFRLDQFYRKFNYHVSMSAQASLMAELSEKVENLYSNNYLLKLNDRRQSFVDKADSWDASPVPLQKNFFERFIQPFLSKKNKVCVIISDALRYEIGDELLTLVRQEDRYDAHLEPVLSMLPSYTQLCMAALLPNKVLELADNESGTVMVDGLSSQGTANRARMLSLSASWRGTAVKADTVMSLKSDECRALVRDHDVLYVYHNRIDVTGDKRESEERVFEAVEETLQGLVKLIKKLTGANANNLLVTADHGFIYQNRALDGSDFSAEEAEGDLILFRDRRFLLGKGLKEAPGLRKFRSSQLGLTGDMEVQIPKSINRLRLKGSGSRYVHGGASLQEVVIPVIKINKKRQSDLSSVDVDIIRGTSSVITSGQLAVVFYQSQPVTEKVQGRTLFAGIYTLAGGLISDSHNLVFDVISDNSRDRERQVRFLLTSKADEVNGQEVILRLDEKYSGTSHYSEYKSIRYLMRRSFTSDFDF